MQFLRVGGSRAYGRRQGICGAFGGSGRNDGMEDSASAKGPIEFYSHWRSSDGNPSSKASTACSPLQFILDDLALPSLQPACAFRRAVCLSFQPPVAASSFRAVLERKVRLLLLDSRAHSRCADVQAMATLLTQQGLQASVMHPAMAVKPHDQMSLFSRSIGVPFLVVTSGDTDDVVVVDGALREHLSVAPCTPAYQRTLAASTPDLFIGTLARLQHLVTSMASAISLNFASQGVDTPPWRRTAALLSRWAVVLERRAAAVTAAPPHFHPPPAGAVVGGQGLVTVGLTPDTSDKAEAITGMQRPPQPLPSATAGDATSSALWEAAEAQVAAAAAAWKRGDVGNLEDEAVLAGFEGKVHGGAGSAAPHHPFVVVRGFEVGESEAPGQRVRQREAWPSVKPGGLACLCRKQSGGFPGSSTGSEGTWGDSPATVFRSE